MTSTPITAPQSVDDPSGDQPSRPRFRTRLRRSGTDRMLGGVCGGLAEDTGIDPLLWRVGFVGLTLAGGAGILVYLLLWLLMPPAPRGPDERTGRIDQLVERAHAVLTQGRRAG